MPKKVSQKPLTVAPLKQRFIRFLRLDKHPLPCMAAKQLAHDEHLRREQALERQVKGLRVQNNRLHQELLETRDILETQQTMAPPDAAAVRELESARERVWRARRAWASCKLRAKHSNPPGVARHIAEQMAELAPELAAAHEALKAIETRRDPAAQDARMASPAPAPMVPLAPNALPPLTSRRRSREAS